MGSKSSSVKEYSDDLLHIGEEIVKPHRTDAATDCFGVSTISGEKCYNPKDPTLTFVKGDDDMDFEYNNYKSLRARMSCGHTVTPTSLTNWCRRLLNQGDFSFKCGCENCDAEWSFEEVCKMALLTPEETEDFEKRLFANSKDCNNIKSCPGCKSAVLRTDFNDLTVNCTVCSAENNRMYYFCWQCLREWKGPRSRSDHCGNDGCTSTLEILKTCSDVVFQCVRGINNCPSVRACPTCGILVEHDGTKCKNIKCVQCKVEFCFVCLKLTKECLKAKEMSWYEQCASGVAPRQTSIPQWQSD